MAVKYAKGACGKCGTSWMFPILEIPLHIIEPGVILCWQCCKEQHYWDDKRCSICSEKTCCKGRFRTNMSKNIKQIKGV